MSLTSRLTAFSPKRIFLTCMTASSVLFVLPAASLTHVAPAPSFVSSSNFALSTPTRILRRLRGVDIVTVTGQRYLLHDVNVPRVITQLDNRNTHLVDHGDFTRKPFIEIDPRLALSVTHHSLFVGQRDRERLCEAAFGSPVRNLIAVEERDDSLRRNEQLRLLHDVFILLQSKVEPSGEFAANFTGLRSLSAGAIFVEQHLPLDRCQLGLDGESKNILLSSVEPAALLRLPLLGALGKHRMRVAQVTPSSRTVVDNTEPAVIVLIWAGQCNLNLGDVLVPCVADHFGEQEDLILLPKCLTKTVFVNFKPLILHRFAL